MRQKQDPVKLVDEVLDFISNFRLEIHVIQCVAEVLWLLVLSGVAISLTLLLLRTGTTHSRF